jgi:hypothetical protein
MVDAVAVSTVAWGCVMDAVGVDLLQANNIPAVAAINQNNRIRFGGLMVNSPR